MYKPPALIAESSQAKHNIVHEASSTISITSRYKSIYLIKPILKHSETFSLFQTVTGSAYQKIHFFCTQLFTCKIVQYFTKRCVSCFSCITQAIRISTDQSVGHQKSYRPSVKVSYPLSSHKIVVHKKKTAQMNKKAPSLTARSSVSVYRPCQRAKLMFQMSFLVFKTEKKTWIVWIIFYSNKRKTTRQILFCAAQDKLIWKKWQ